MLEQRHQKTLEDSALNFGSKPVTSMPVRRPTAPKHATDLRVGAWSTTGSFSSGGTHMRQRVPCCWKWHSSELHRSTLGSTARRRSFFKGSLGCRVGLGDHRTRFAQPKAHLSEQTLTLAHAQLNAVAPAQMLGQYDSSHSVCSKPNSRGPRRKSSSRPCHCSLLSRLGRPGRSPSCSPAKPICSKRLTQRCTVRSLSSSQSAA